MIVHLPGWRAVLRVVLAAVRAAVLLVRAWRAVRPVRTDAPAPAGG